MLLHLAAVAEPASGAAAAGQAPVSAQAAGAGGAAAASLAAAARRRRIQLRQQQQQKQLLLEKSAGETANAADLHFSAAPGRGEAQAQPEAVPSPEGGPPPALDAGAAAGVTGPTATQGPAECLQQPSGLSRGQQAATGDGCDGLTCLATAALSPHNL